MLLVLVMKGNLLFTWMSEDLQLPFRGHGVPEQYSTTLRTEHHPHYMWASA